MSDPNALPDDVADRVAESLNRGTARYEVLVLGRACPDCGWGSGSGSRGAGNPYPEVPCRRCGATCFDDDPNAEPGSLWARSSTTSPTMEPK